MKNSTLVILGTMLLTAAAASAAPHGMPKFKKHGEKAAKTAIIAKKQLRVAAEGNKAWRPTHEKNYGWDGEGWQLEDTYTISYDGQGRVVSETAENYDGWFTRTTNTYNANGMLATQLIEGSADGETYENSQRILREYDERLTSVITLNNQWVWQNDDWNQSGNNYKRVITRDAAGNITQVEIQSLFQGVYDPIKRLTITYGADGKAETMTESNLDYDYATGEYVWNDETPYTNVVWERTDGQIVDLENLFSGANRLKSADVDDEEMTMHFEVEYTEKGYTVTMTGDDGEYEYKGTSVFEWLDQNESYEIVTTTQYLVDGEVDEEGIETERVEYNEWGNLMLSLAKFSDGMFEEVYEYLEGEVEYDATHGYPLTYTVKQQYFDEELEDYVTENQFRAEYSDYIDASAGISDVTVDDADAPVEYFNLQGMRISQPAAGQVVIRRQGSKASKVLVK